MSFHPTRAVLAAALLGGCASYPAGTSLVDGNRYHLANMHTYATRVTKVDGVDTLVNQNPVPIEPGQHVLTLETRPVSGFRIPVERTLALEVAPCQRYYIVAERDNRLAQDWTPRVEYQEFAPGFGCKQP